MKLDLLLFRADEEDKEHPAPVTSRAVSIVFVAGCTLILALYSSETLRCSVQENQVACLKMTSVKDCDNIVQASCTTKCASTPYSYCADWKSHSMSYSYQFDSSSPTTSCYNQGTWLSGLDTNNYVVSGTASPASPLGTWSSTSPPADALTCKAFYTNYAAEKAKTKTCTDSVSACVSYGSCTYSSSSVPPYGIVEHPIYGKVPNPNPPGWSSSCADADPKIEAGYGPGCVTCCASHYPLASEELDQCCGIMKEVKICLNAASTIGVVGGYASLWYSICQGFYLAVTMIARFRAKHLGKAKDGADAVHSEESVELVSSKDPDAGGEDGGGGREEEERSESHSLVTATAAAVDDATAVATGVATGAVSLGDSADNGDVQVHFKDSGGV